MDKVPSSSGLRMHLLLTMSAGLLFLFLWLPSNDVGKVSVLNLPLWTLMLQKKNTGIVAFSFCLFVNLPSTKRGSQGSVCLTEIYHSTKQERGWEGS